VEKIRFEQSTATEILYIRSMKKWYATLIFILSITLVAQAQKDSPQLLKEPSNWTFERFALPPAFAPNFPFKGAEELRFSPGMFSKDSANYFTYAFVAELDNTTSIPQSGIKNYLLLYFKGLCASTAKDRKLSVDTSKITVVIERKKSSPGNEIIYSALLNVFGVFADGALVKLNMEVKVLANAAAKKTYLFFIVSPLPRTDRAWKQLYTLQKHFTIPS
jgi:hypothetical protein